MAISWYPLQAGQTVTHDMWNELIASIQDGSIFTSTSFVSDLVTTLDTRVSTLEQKVALLEDFKARNWKREQFTLTLGQTVINLDDVPILDSDIVFLNGLVLSKSDVPVGVEHDYSISGSILTLHTDLGLQILAGDKLSVNYSYEVA